MIPENAKQKVEKHFKSDLKMLNMSQGFRKLSLYFFSLKLPFFWIKGLIIQGIRKLHSKWGNSLSAKYIKQFYKNYFMYQGMHHYWAQESPPKKTDKPYIIITMRYDYMSSLYLYTLLEVPTIIPFLNGFSKSFKKNFPENGIHPHIDSISYDDAPLGNTISQLQTLLDNGYPIVIHLNHGPGNMFETDGLLLHKAILDILDWDFDTYFLAMDGYENRRYSTAFNGTLISCIMQKKETLFKSAISDTSEEKVRLITSFFGFTHHALLPD